MENREFLFRGKHICNGEWYEGSLLVWPNGNCMIKQFGEFPFESKNCEVLPETVGQFTGEFACGSRLFEGDIIRYDDELMVVEWSVPDSGYVVRSLDGSNWETVLGQIVVECAEIVGNIHDNPELLEVCHAVD